MLEVAELHELGHGVPVPVPLDVSADLFIPCSGPLEELHDPGVEWYDESIVFVVVIVFVSGIELLDVGGLVRSILFREAGDFSAGELLDPVGRLRVTILDGDDEVWGFVAVVSLIPLGGSLCELMGQISLLLIFQISELLDGLAEFGLVIPFLASDGFEQSLGDLHDGL
jgi:hypothetical protein